MWDDTVFVISTDAQMHAAGAIMHCRLVELCDLLGPEAKVQPGVVDFARFNGLRF